MAAVHAGMKRPYHELDGHTSAPSSREASPLRKYSREANGPPRLHSGYETPSINWNDQARRVDFDPHASIVLIGIKGVGKSSLGVIAATAYNRTLIDTERAFSDAAGTTAQSYRKLHGTAEYRRKHRQVLESTLQSHLKDCVIISGFHDLEDEGAALLREYAKTHAVIHITRDVAGIHSYLQVWSVKRVEQVLHASGPILRSCANFEFFNLTEALARDDEKHTVGLEKSKPLFLTLKRVERDFLKLLRIILGDHERTQSHHSAYPLSKVPVHERNFTICARVRVDEVIDRLIDLDDVQVGIDAVELVATPQRSSTQAGTTQIRTMDSGMVTAPGTVPGEVDLLRLAEAFASIRRATIVPLVLTVEGSSSEGVVDEARAALTSYCFRLAPEYCTVSLSYADTQISSWLRSRGRTLVIGIADFKQRPLRGWHDPQCIQTYERADSLGCSIVKMTMPLVTLEDNFAAQSLIAEVETSGRQARLTAYNTGKEGRLSKCFNRILTPVRSPMQSHETHETVKDDITARDVFNALFATFVYDPMHYFIYGANVSYSLSPAMHNAAYSACGMKHSYATYSSPTLDDFEKLSRVTDFGGAAVVQPYKTSVVHLLDGLSSHAQAIGSVNTILPIRQLGKDGKLPNQDALLSQLNKSGPVVALYGDNTDWIGIRACLRRGLSPANTVRPQSTALVCGAGGQARSAIYALLSLGVRNVFVCNRTIRNAETLARHYNTLLEQSAITELDSETSSHCRVRVLETFESAWPGDFRQPSMIVSSIPTQTADGSPTNFRLPDAWLRNPNGGVVIELAYRPMITPIVTQMRTHTRKSWVLMDGFDVLPEQAFAQFELFTGRRAPRKLMREEVLKRYREEQESLRSTRNLDPNPPGT